MGGFFFFHLLQIRQAKILRSSIVRNNNNAASERILYDIKKTRCGGLQL